MFGPVYTAKAVSRILGLSVDCCDPTPRTEEGVITVYYGGWDFMQLYGNGKVRMSIRVNSDLLGWFERMPRQASGYYRVNLRVPRSNRKSWGGQTEHLRDHFGLWKPAPFCVAVTALLVHTKKVFEDVLCGGTCRCAESLPGGCHVSLMSTSYGVDPCVRRDGRRSRHIWLAAARNIGVP